MKKLLALLAVLLATLAALAHRPALVAERGARRAWPFRARGAVHVHTSRSHDARGDVDDVARAARRAGLDFVALTDHNADAVPGIEGYRRGVLVLSGQEKSTDAGHALVLGASLPFRLDGDPASVARDVSDFGGFVVAAHPLSPRPESRWTGGFDGVAGLEILSFGELSAWPGSAPARAALLLRYAFDPGGTLLRGLRPNTEALKLWDRQLSLRPLAGVVGSDAHGGIRVGPLFLPAPSYRRVFELASQHLLLRASLSGALAQDRALVLDALREGRGYAALDGLANASGFYFEARSGEARALMGESLQLRDSVELRAVADAPRGTTLVLLRDGEPVCRGREISYATDQPGVYRVEAHLPRDLVPGPDQPWILSNAISVFDEAELLARARRARSLPPEVETPPTGSVEALDSFGAPKLAAEWRVDQQARRARATLESGALRLDFTLGDGPHTHAAACRWKPLDLSGVRNVLFRVRARRPLRFDLQVRTLDPKAPGGVRIWRRSVRADVDWSGVSVPLDALNTYDPNAGRPDLSRVTGLYFHVDESNLPPGYSGTLWIDDLALGH